jgi:cytochrome bd-type quinol oxidase subunit 2
MSSVDTILTQLQTSTLGHAISKSHHLVGASLQIVHVLAFVLLLASLVLISLRLLGVAFNRQPVQQVARDATRLIWLGLALTLVSGSLMFIASPKLYFHNSAFDLKMLLLLAAVLVQLTLFRTVARHAAPPPRFTRASVSVALLLWFGVAFAGRIIGFI